MAESSRILDEHLHQSYLNAEYCVVQPEFILRIGENPLILNELLMDNNAFYYAFITAENPYSVVLSDIENEVRMKDLAELLDKMKKLYLIGFGTDQERKWKPENSFLVLDITSEKAIEIGKQFEQNAIVVGGMGIPARLEICL